MPGCVAALRAICVAVLAIPVAYLFQLDDTLVQVVDHKRQYDCKYK